jgi:adenylate cyclase
VQFTSFRTRLICYIALLLTLVLGTVFISVDRSAYTNTRNTIDTNLLTGRGVFNAVLLEREQSFKALLKSLSRDFGFRGAYNEAKKGDYGTVLSAVENLLLLRTENADLMMVVDYDYQMIADTSRFNPPETDFPWPELLEAAEETEDQSLSSFILYRNQAYQVVLVPILIPLIDGWLMMGQRLDEDYVQTIKDIITVDVSVLTKDENGTTHVLATTLTGLQKDSLESQTGSGSSGQSMMQTLGEDEFVSLPITLPNLSGIDLQVYMQQSLTEALRPYRALETRLALLFSIGMLVSLLVATLLGTSVTQPVLKLAGMVKKIESGDFHTSAESGRKDEIGQLEKSVGNMARGLAEKERVRDLLGKVVSPEIADELMKQNVALGGENRAVTILFSDIRNFTDLCEGRAPQAILSMLNEYLTEVSTAIEASKGVVDKFIGDAVMALFGAPLTYENDVENALNAALLMQERVAFLNGKNRDSGPPPLTTGIGIHTGNVVAGNLGSANRLNYTVIGDAVNLASRLEALTKEYGVGIMVSEDTREAAQQFIYRELDTVRVKGRIKPVRIFELCGKPGQLSQKRLAAINSFEMALASYRTRDFNSAKLKLTHLLQQEPGSRLYHLFLQRIDQYADTPPDENWDTVFTFTSK